MRFLNIFLMLSLSTGFASDKVAITIKTIGDVQRAVSGSDEFSGLTRGNPLSDNDVVRTGTGGFVVAIYLDDKSTIKISENSEFVISGSRDGNAINKQITVSYGKLRASVAKQKGEEFIISTPTSVASIKGTDFVVVCDPVQGDMFVTLIGVIAVTNNVTGETKSVSKGETATSLPDGTVEVHETTEEESQVAEEDEDDDEQDQHELKFEIEDQEGGKHEIILKYE